MKKKYNPFKVNFEVYEELKNGIFCVFKSNSLTSAETLELVKKKICSGIHISGSSLQNRIYKLKVGHGGTLDSAAVGILVIGTGRGCKLLTKLLSGPKSYIVTGQFGVATDTYNDVGRVTLERPFCHITEKDVVNCISRFKGNIFQTPPSYSALKLGGKRMSDLVRAGREVKLEPREVECKSMELLNFSPPFFTMSVHCGGGFYVRSLVHDMGLALDSCAHVKYLCRFQQGPFVLKDCILCDDLNLRSIILAINELKLKYRNEFRDLM